MGLGEAVENFLCHVPDAGGSPGHFAKVFSVVLKLTPFVAPSVGPTNHCFFLSS